MNRDEARRAINERALTDFIPLQRSAKAGRNMYVCPICGSGTGKNGTGAFHIYPETNRVFCYSRQCFTDKGEDTLGALRKIWNCSETEALERAGYRLDRDETPHQRQAEHKENMEHKERRAQDNSYFYQACHLALKNSPEALDYLHGRGIKDENIDRFNLGYCATWKPDGVTNAPETKRVIIPRTPGTYLARLIEKPRTPKEAQYEKQVQGRGKDLFNLGALDGSETPFVCEGELDAISLLQAGAGAVVGITSTTNTGVFLEEAKKHPDAVFILALDNDEPGRKAQAPLADGMKAAGLAYISADTANLYGGTKDGNAAYVKDPERLGAAIQDLLFQAQNMKAGRDADRAEDLRKRTGEGMLEDFLFTVTTKRDFEPIPTGILDIDRATQGGFIRKTLVMLGAPPAMGKTALAQWIFENIAKTGQDVLYINLEMSREQLLARSLSRLVWKYEKKDISALDILRGYSWTDEQRQSIEAAADIYRRDIAPHFIYNPDGVTNGIDSILQAMEAETARIKAQGKPEPLVCIDYLQLIDSGERDAIEGMKSVIFKLKDFAKRNNTVVFSIMANNRASNRAGTVEMESGRDSSAIEYSGDLLLGLSYTAIEDRKAYSYTDEDGRTQTGTYDLDTIRRLKKEAYEAGKDVPAVCKEVSLKVLKNRFGEAEHRAKLIFDGKHSTFNLTEYKDRSYTDHYGKTPFDE